MKNIFLLSYDVERFGRNIFTSFKKMGVSALDHFKSFKLMDENKRLCDSSSFGIKDDYDFILSDVARLHMIAFWYK